MNQSKFSFLSLLSISLFVALFVVSCNNASEPAQETPAADATETSTVAPDSAKAQLNTTDTLVADSLKTEQNPPAIRKVR